MTDHSKTPPPTSDANSAERRVVLGRVRTAVGLAGWVKVQSFTDPPDNILNYRTWQLSSPSGWQARRLLNSRWSGRELQVQFEGVVGRTAAELLRNSEVAVSRSELPPAAPGEYYRDDLLGLAAVTSKGERLGRLDHFLEGPAHPFMVFIDRDSKAENLVPLTKDRVQSVDFEKGMMVIDWTLDWAE